MNIIRKRGLVVICVLAISGLRCASSPRQDLSLDWDLSIASSRKSGMAPVQINPLQKLPEKAGLRDLLRWALKNNRAIAIARAQWQKSQTKYAQVVTLPDPILTYTYYLENVETRVGPQRHRLSLVQPIPFPYKLYLKGEIVDDEVEIAELAYERTIRDQIAKVQKSYYELSYLERAVDITRENEKLLGHFLEAAAAEHDKGAAPVADLLRAQSQVAQMQYDLIRIEELKQVEIGKLNALLNRKPDAPLVVGSIEFPKARPLPPFMALYNYAREKQQEILAAKVEQKRADHQLSLAFSQYFPDLSIGASWIETGERTGTAFPPADDGQDAWMLQFGVTLPIWLPRKNATTQEARLEIGRTKSLEKDLENALAASLKKTYYRGENAYRLVELYRSSLLPQAEHSIAIAENWYRDGKGSLSGLLEVQSAYLNFSLALARAKADYAQRLIEMARLSGGSLPENFLANEKKSRE